MRFFALLILILLFTTNGFSQKSKDLKKANQLFKEDKYALAIPFYKKVLTTKSNLSIKSKLAYCYKITNQLAEAVDLYAVIVENDRAKTKSFYDYAECLMGIGQYETAKEWFQIYAKIETADERVDRMIASCDFAKTVPAYFDYAEIEPFSQNSAEDDNAPIFWDNGIVFTSDRKGKVKFLDTKSGATDRNYLRLYHSEQLPDGTFGKPKEYISKINDARKNTGMATFQADGSSMFFTRNGNHLNRQNAYCLQLFEAQSNNGKNWDKAEVVNFCRKESNYMHPAVSPNGQLLFFVSDKAGGLGGTDIYVSKKGKTKWGKPVNLGNKINTGEHEGFPFMHQNGKLYFCSKGHLGLGGFDIFVTEMGENGEWMPPTNLGNPINSPADDISIFIDEAEERGVFTSSRKGGDDNIFLVSFLPAATVEKKEVASMASMEEKLESAIIPKPVALQSTWKLPNEEKVAEKIPEFEENNTIREDVLVRKDFLKVDNWDQIIPNRDTLYNLPTVQFLDGEYFVTFKIAKELDRVAEVLKTQPSIIIELAAHTANLGSFEEKMSLTQNRADSMVDYLQRKGIAKERLVAKGYGGQQPLNKCLLDIDCSIEEHAINDRIE
ncbi:MAG: OmpA family protein, partial [Bacteroidota bacterium]